MPGPLERIQLALSRNARTIGACDVLALCQLAEEEADPSAPDGSPDATVLTLAEQLATRVPPSRQFAADQVRPLVRAIEQLDRRDDGPEPDQPPALAAQPQQPDSHVAPSEPATAAPAQPKRSELLASARELGIAGAARLNNAKLAAAVEEARALKEREQAAAAAPVATSGYGQMSDAALADLAQQRMLDLPAGASRAQIIAALEADDAELEGEEDEQDEDDQEDDADA